MASSLPAATSRGLMLSFRTEGKSFSEHTLLRKAVWPLRPLLQAGASGYSFGTEGAFQRACVRVSEYTFLGSLLALRVRFREHACWLQLDDKDYTL